MKARTRLALLEGAYICQYAYPEEYAYLCEDGNSEAVNVWLADIDQCLTRLGEDGAFVMTPAQIRATDTTRIRDDLARFRDVYGPYVRMLQFIRSGKDEFNLQPGEYVQHAELTQAVNDSATLDAQLRSLHGIVRDGSSRLKNAEMVRRLLEHLARDGFLVLVNANTEVYQTTGKVTQLSQVLTYIAENSEIVGRQSDAVAEDEPGTGLFD
jgi:hypothetical protein